jgi:hypothetical protein
MNGQTAAALVLGIAVTMLVPALVWATVIAGLVQIVREKVREGRAAAQGHGTQKDQQPAHRL